MVDYAEKERQFIDSLAADTGRDLAGWMAAISEQKLSHRNEIIDWLRRQRFTFDNASWLERIHHNGGQPIYAGKPDLKALGLDAVEPPARQHGEAPPPQRAAPGEPAAPPLPPTAPAAAAAPGDLEPLLVKAKAFRPLALHLIKAIEAAVPGVVVSIRGALIAFSAPREFAVILASARDVKLGLALGDSAERPGLENARLPGAGPAITHMVALTDVRRIDPALMAQIATAVEIAQRP